MGAQFFHSFARGLVFNSPMHHHVTRRDFLLRTVAAAAALAPAALAVEPFKRTKPRFTLGLAAYSFRQYFKEGKSTEPKADPAKRIDMLDFVNYCAEQDCAAEVTSYFFPAKLTTDFLLQLKRAAFVRGVELSGTAVGNTFTHPAGPKRDAEITLVKEWIDHAAVMGAPHLRVFAGETQKTSKDEAKKLCIAALEECCEYAGKKGIFLGLENHGGIIGNAADLIEIIQAVQSPWCGVNLDSGNFHTDDPMRDFALCAPYAVNVQWKAEIQPRASKEKKPADLPLIAAILREANYQGYLTLEYEAAEDPYMAVPRLLKQMRGVLAGA
jgi:sugar phosphate isomerase/epimerase